MVIRKVIWNNLVNGYLNSTDWKDRNSNDTYTTFSDGVATINFLNSPGTYRTMMSNNSHYTYANHLYFFRFLCKTNMINESNIGMDVANIAKYMSSTTMQPNEWMAFASRVRGEQNRNSWAYCPIIGSITPNSGFIAEVKNIVIVDLTKMFGPGNEPSTSRFIELCTLNGINLDEPQSKNYNGTELIWITDGETTVSLLESRNHILMNTPHIKSVNGNVAIFNTDLKAPLKECKIHFEPVQEGSGDPSPTNVRPISGWNEIQVGLPAEYQEVEYIGAENASPYIDTGIYLTDELQAEIHYYNDKKEAFLFGSRQSTSGPFCNFNIDKDGQRCRFDYSNVGTGFSGGGFGSGTHDGEYIFTFTNRVGTLRNLATDDVRTRENYKNANGTLFATAPVLLFAVRTGANVSLGTSAGNLRIYSAKFWFGGTYTNDVITGAELVRNFVPCIRKSDNVVGMYDTVTTTFYTSQNSDTFTAGPIVNSPSILVDWTTEAGTAYGGYIDLIKGELVMTWECITIMPQTGNNATIPDYMWYFSDSVYQAKKPGQICSHCTVHYDPFSNWTEDIKIHHLQNNSIIIGTTFFEEAGIEKTSNAFYEYCQQQIDRGTPLQIAAELATPIHYSITPSIVKALRGTNKIWSNANGNIELAYWSH